MSIFKFYLFISLLIQIISSEKKIENSLPFDSDDIKTCVSANKNKLQGISTNTCISVNSKLKSKNSQCCKININYDQLLIFKLKNKENWKKEAAKMYGFDENLSEKEIRENYIKIHKQNLCSIVGKNGKMTEFFLYTSSFFSYGGKITYDCGKGEKTYIRKDYHPKDKLEQKLKDNFESSYQFTENDCYKIASKFMSDELISCWNKVIKVNKDDNYYREEREECRAYEKSQYKSIFQSKFKDFILRKTKIEETWKCYDKKGKKYSININTYTGKFKIN